MPDTIEELRRAAAWARERLESNPTARIGIIVPDLSRLRSKATRILTDVLHPAALPDSGSKSFHISLGAPLSESPLVCAALLILDLGTGEPMLLRMSQLLRSPWVAGAELERAPRALLDARLRNLERQTDNLPEEQSPSDWSRSFSQLLNAAGWPGSRTLSSQEYQAAQAWNNTLSQFATLDRPEGFCCRC